MNFKAHIRAGITSAANNSTLVPLGLTLCVALPVTVFVMIYLPALIKLHWHFDNLGSLSGMAAALKNPGEAMGSMLAVVLVYTIGFWFAVIVALWCFSLWQASALWAISYLRLEPAGVARPRTRDILRAGRKTARQLTNFTLLFMLALAVLFIAYVILAAMVSALSSSAYAAETGMGGRMIPIMLWVTAGTTLALCVVFMLSAGLLGLAFMGLEGRRPANALAQAFRVLWRREDMLNFTAMLVMGFCVVQGIMWLVAVGLAGLPVIGAMSTTLWAALWLVLDVWLWLVIVGAAVDALAAPDLWVGNDPERPAPVSPDVAAIASIYDHGAIGDGLDVWQCSGDDYCAEPGGVSDESIHGERDSDARGTGGAT